MHQHPMIPASMRLCSPSFHILILVSGILTCKHLSCIGCSREICRQGHSKRKALWTSFRKEIQVGRAGREEPIPYFLLLTGFHHGLPGTRGPCRRR